MTTDDRADAGADHRTDRTANDTSDRGAPKRSAHSPDRRGRVGLLILRESKRRNRYGGRRTAIRKVFMSLLLNFPNRACVRTPPRGKRFRASV